jgi:hypothetical protein
VQEHDDWATAAVVSDIETVGLSEVFMPDAIFESIVLVVYGNISRIVSGVTIFN